ncbi:hypothetical protein [Allocoleopsis franciscana]|nr:hypothetical protein [Allocoleopsis franciscana]
MLRGCFNHTAAVGVNLCSSYRIGEAIAFVPISAIAPWVLDDS